MIESKTTLLSTAAPSWLLQSLSVAEHAAGSTDTALELARTVGSRLPQPGHGHTRLRWAALAELAARDVTIARVLEAHADAGAILGEAGDSERFVGLWGVFAAESADDRVQAHSTDDGWILSGIKPWCSLAGVLDRALVTAWVDAEDRRLFAVDLRHPAVTVAPASRWVSRGLPNVVSTGLRLDRVPAAAVGGRNWYLLRDGFAWGGLGVAACWYGAAEAIAARLRGLARGELDDLARGAVDSALHAAACVLTDAARQVDSGHARGDDGALLAQRVRCVVADAAESVIAQVGRTAGPGPLSFEAEHASRVADLQIYLRQHHGERDLARLGRLSERFS